MHSQLRERIRLMRARLDNAAPVAEIRAESQLFVTPAPVCDRLVTLAEISNRDHILEPSAGTGAILRAIRDTAPEAMCDAVEINSGLVRYLRENFNGVRVQCGDFMEWQPVQYYSRIIMNPPFSHGQDIRHILRAFSLLRPGGVLVVLWPVALPARTAAEGRAGALHRGASGLSSLVCLRRPQPGAGPYPRGKAPGRTGSASG